MKHSSFSRLFAHMMLWGMLAGLCMALAPLPTHAQVRPQTQKLPIVPATTHAAASGHVTILVLDMSGSMSQNDPDRIRCSAANAYIDLTGPGDLVGAIGLDQGSGARGGPYNFMLALNWSDPVKMDILSDREALKQKIAQSSGNCRPDEFTPTYDALSKAIDMLTSATQGKKLSGSVILLTDGVPCSDNACSDQGQQISAIKSDLVPKFQQHGWPIDSIALGSGSATDFGFLKDISNATSGKFYEDDQGEVPGVSPLNVMPFFAAIFAQRNGLTLKKDIDPTSLTGGTTSRNFQVGAFVDHLDAIAVTDNPNATVTLTTPTGQVLPPTTPGATVLTDDRYHHYTIFSIDNPQQGTWTLNVTGSSGQFLLNSLISSSLKVSIVTPEENHPVFPLGQNITISAVVKRGDGSTVCGHAFAITAKVTGPAFTGGVDLNDDKSPCTYTGEMTVPQNAAAGSYDIMVSVSQGSGTAISTAERIIRLELFPLPFFVSSKTNQPTDTPVDTTVIQWLWPIQIFYSIPLIDRFSPWALQNHPAQPYAILPGEVQSKGQPYPGATVTATFQRMGSKDAPMDATVIDDGAGRFHVQFIPPADGTYIITFQTSGTFKDSHGDFGTTQRVANVTIQSAPFDLLLHALLITVLYFFILYFLYRLLRFSLTPKPFGEWVCSEEGEVVARSSFSRARRGLIQWFYHPNLVNSRQAGLPAGLQFRFRFGKVIEVKPEGHAGNNWRRGDGDELRRDYQVASELRFRPGGDADDEADEPATYAIIARPSRNEEDSYRDDDDDDTPRQRRQQRPKPRPKPRRSSRRGRSGDDDYYDDDEY
jgi:hypothetical protein